MGLLATPGGLALVSLLAIAPAALGSNRPLPWAINALWAAVAIGLVVLAELVSSRQRPAQLRAPVALPTLLFVVVVGWAFFQSLDLSGVYLPNPVWDYAASAGIDGGNSISVSPEDTIWRICRLLSVGAVFLAAYILGRDDRWAGIILRAILVAACLYAVYGLLQISVQLDKILWFDVNTSGRLTSTFVSPNNAATFFGLASVIAMGMIIREFRHVMNDTSSHRSRQRVAIVVGALAGRLGLEVVLFFTVFVAVLLTASRGGIIFTVAALLSLVGLQAFKRMSGSATAQMGGAVAAVAAVGLVLLIFQLSGASFLERLTEGGLTSEGRSTMLSTGIRILQDNWLVGTGYGTWEEIYPLYRDHPQMTVSDRAHNDYLELFVGLGAIGATALLLAILIPFAHALRGFFTRQRNTHFAAIGVGASVLVGLHSLTDFSLQIEAIAFVYAAILGVAFAQSQTARKA